MSEDADQTPREPTPGSSTPHDGNRLAPEVVARLYEEHGDELRAFLAGVLRNRELVNDAVQSTFARAVEVGHGSREETRKGWLFRVALNEALRIKRRTRIDDRSRRVLAESRETTGANPEPPLAEAVRAERIEAVRRALETLPSTQREVVRQRIDEGRTFAAIAEELGLPLGTVLTRMRTAMRTLTRHFTDHHRDRDE